MSSRDDPFLEVTSWLSRDLQQAGVDTALVVVPGPHDYEFNRGLGSVELLLFHGLEAYESP